jgi:hypothetical protein
MTVSECLKSIGVGMPDVPEVVERVTTKSLAIARLGQKVSDLRAKGRGEIQADLKINISISA